MIKFESINKTETYVELTTDKGEKMYMPATSVILVDDESGAIAVKNIATRKTVGLVIDGQPVPPKPQYRWVDDGWTCKGFDKWQQMKQQESTDSGATWHDTGVVSATSLIEADSEDCGYIPRNYLRFKALEDCVFSFNKQDGEVLYYSLDSGDTWTELTGITPTIHSGENIYWKGQVKSFSSTTGRETRFSSCFHGICGGFNIEGNIMSLLYGDNFEGKTSLEGNDKIFGYLFASTSVVDASNLILPATILTDGCYENMFYECGSLTTAPELPATTLAENCYSQMFFECGSLTTAPELPATTLAEFCYAAMFWYCFSLATAPELPATTLANYCYLNMFNSCESLTTAPELPATTLTIQSYYGMFENCSSINYIKCLATDASAVNCTYNWVSNVASTGTFVKAAGSSWSTGKDGIPRNWNVEDA